MVEESKSWRPSGRSRLVFFFALFSSLFSTNVLCVEYSSLVHRSGSDFFVFFFFKNLSHILVLFVFLLIEIRDVKVEKEKRKYKIHFDEWEDKWVTGNENPQP